VRASRRLINAAMDVDEPAKKRGTCKKTGEQSANWDTTESSGVNAPTLQMIDMMVRSQKFFKRAAELYRCSPCAGNWTPGNRQTASYSRKRDRWKRGYAEKRAYQWFFLFICVARSA
jgi:hypothetical protein